MKEKKFKRNCPKCNKEVGHTTKKGLAKALKHNKLCVSCSALGDNWIDVSNLTRECMDCGKELKYSNTASYRSALENNSLCKSCGQSGDRNHQYGREYTEEEKEIKKRQLHSEETKLKQKEAMRRYRAEHPEENIQKRVLRKHGNNLEQYYEEKRLASIGKQAGENNPMYGKPSPQGSGNGWSGWYMGHFFRSLIELSYMVEFLSVTGVVWQSAETREFKIEYTDASGQIRNYFPDFFVNNKYLVEIKPKNLFRSESVKLKKDAAEKWCLENGYEYLLIEPKKLSNDKIMELYNSGEIKFTDRYEEKFMERYFK